MKSRWLFTLFASIPLVAAILVIQSCGGTGGPTTTQAGGTDTVTADFLALLSPEQQKASYIGSQACANCHGGTTSVNGGPHPKSGGINKPAHGSVGTMQRPSPQTAGYSHSNVQGAKPKANSIYAEWSQTIHFQKGVTCERCHGPGSVHQANPTKANILTFPGSTSPAVCAQCHGPTTDEYNFSKHHELIPDPITEAAANPATFGKASRCVACHSGLFRTQVYEQGVDPNTMTDQQITDICTATAQTVPHTASCVTCHDPHANTANLTGEGEQAYLRHKVFNSDTSQVGPGTKPDTFTHFDQICAQCHNGRGVDPSDAKLTSGTARPSMHDSNQFNMLMGLGGVVGNETVQSNTAHATAPGQCTKCHMPNARHTFTVSYDVGCAPCHTATDAAARADTVKSDILNGLASLRSRMAAWAQGAFGDPALWDYTTLIESNNPPPDQALVPIEVKRARHNYYFIVRSGDYGVHNAPYAKTLLKVANDNLDSIHAPSPAIQNMSKAAKLRMTQLDKIRAERSDLRDH